MKKNVLITDFDNTLYDWFEVWHRSFTAMVDEVVRITGIEKEALLPEMRTVFQKHGTSEYAFVLEELPSLQRIYHGKDIAQELDAAIHAYRRARKSSLALYHGVKETLQYIRSRGAMVVIYTESLAYYTNFRVRKLGLDDLVDFIYSPRDHALPAAVTSHTESEDARLLHARHNYIPDGVLKPNPAVLFDILMEINRSADECIYLGDSPMKDVAMAQAARITDVLAAYGAVQHHPEYNLLRRVSHWTDADVQREKNIARENVVPSHTITSFSEIADFF